MSLHALTGKRELVTGQWFTRCGLYSHRDPRPLPRGYKVGVAFQDFNTALHERDVDCSGCRIALSALELLVLRFLLKYPGGVRLIDSDTTKYNVNDNKVEPKLYLPQMYYFRLEVLKIIRVDGPYHRLTPLGKSLTERNSK